MEWTLKRENVFDGTIGLKRRRKMKRIFLLLLIVFLSIQLISCCDKVVRPSGLIVYLPKCEKLFTYEDAHISIKTVSFTIPSVGPVSIGGIDWNREKILDATNAAKMLDEQNYNNCKDLCFYALSIKDDVKWQDFVNTYYNNILIINQLAFLLEMNGNNQTTLDNWITTYFSPQLASIQLSSTGINASNAMQSTSITLPKSEASITVTEPKEEMKEELKSLEAKVVETVPNKFKLKKDIKVLSYEELNKLK